MAAVHCAKIRYAQELAAYTLLQWNVALSTAESKGKMPPIPPPASVIEITRKPTLQRRRIQQSEDDAIEPPQATETVLPNDSPSDDSDCGTSRPQVASGVPATSPA